MKLEWTRLRSLDGARDAFEELCRQLAHDEADQLGYDFIAKGTPDGGVECYATLIEGDEWGWQAKFFPEPPSRNQWGELDKSFRRALSTHPKLVRYTVCMPLDRGDPRMAGRKAFKDAWDERVSKWQGWASKAGRTVQIDYWGNHEIEHRLGLERNAGRHRYFFDQQLFSREWFDAHVQAAVDNCGKRYSPRLHVETPDWRNAAAFGCEDLFYERVRNRVAELRAQYYRVSGPSRLYVPDGCKTAFKNAVESFLTASDTISNNLGKAASLSHVSKLADVAAQAAVTCAYASEKKAAADTSDRSEYFRELAHEIGDFREYLQSDEVLLLGATVMLTRGPAGVGKTHFLCDVARARVAAGLPTILLLGQHFDRRPPMAQFLEHLQCEGPSLEVLSALDAAGDAAGRPASL